MSDQSPAFSAKLTNIVNSMPDDPLAQRFVLLVYYFADSELYNEKSEVDRDALVGVVLACSPADLAAVRIRVNAALLSWNALSAARNGDTP